MSSVLSWKYAGEPHIQSEYGASALGYTRRNTILRKMLMPVAIALVLPAIVCGCVFGRKYINLEGTYYPNAADCNSAGAPEVVVEVKDIREFAPSRKCSPMKQSVGYGAFWSSLDDSPEIREHLIGREANMYGMACGDYIGNCPVKTHIKKLVVDAFKLAGFVVVDKLSHDTVGVRATVEVGYFWTYPVMGLWDVDVCAETYLFLHISHGGQNHDFIEKCESKYSAPVVTPDDRVKALSANAEKVVSDLTEKFRKLKSEVLPHN